MRMQLLKIVVVLLIAGSGDTRPQNGADSQAKMIERSDAGWRGIQVTSKSHDIVRDDSSGQRNDTHRDSKDLRYMDQSLRTVATQLLNVTNPQDAIKVNNKELVKTEHTTTPKYSENGPSLIRDISSGINLEPVSYGRPINSKFSYFEASHPGQAMAMTEEELEREMSTTRLITAYKNHPTTTGGISTWILLNAPSTTVKSVEVEKIKTQQPFQTEVRLTVRPSSSIEKVEMIPQPEKLTEKTTPQLTPVITTEKVTVITKKPTVTTTTKKIATTLKPERITQDSEKTESTSSSTTLKVIRTTTTSTSTTSNGTATLTTVLTTKKNQPSRTTPKPKVTTPKTTLHSKPTTTKVTTTTTTTTTTKPATGKPSRPKPTRKTTIKPETAKNETSVSTAKIEKVTFRPVPIITTPPVKPDNTEKRPMFVTKIKASVLMDTQKTPTALLPATTATVLSGSTMFHSNASSADVVQVPVRSAKPIGTKENHVLKVQLKKPVETTQVEIEPIKVNAPILTIEKVDKNKMDEIVMKDTDDLNESRIDLKFDFNPELTKISVETQTEAAATTSTTKRPRHSSKRKKNKNRRRKPTTSMPSSTTVATMPVLMETSGGVVTDPTYLYNAVQESKIAPETKVAANTTKTKKKQPQKAISTQIYNFLSREVMPSFGVMSLVGLGLGLASYFLYPFGGTIARRNYEVEPNYKYNMDEYGGNYGQSEEEMLSKVFQGMTSYENKYPAGKDNYNSNYYNYQHYDGAIKYDTKKVVDSRYPSVSTSPVYKTAENTLPAVKYRNTDFRYPEAQTTPVYYDRKRPDLTAQVGAVSSTANRQFVVGNVPKEYPFDVKVSNLPVDNKKDVGYVSTEVEQTQYDRDVAQGFDYPNAAALHSYGHLGPSTIRPDDGYEEIEITPTAVAVEHGPRSLKVKRAIEDAKNGREGRSLRSKRETVIQIIPSKRELEEEREEMEKEEDLSNEILDIIDSALPGRGVPHKRGSHENNEVEDLEGQIRKRQEEANTRAKASTLKTILDHTEETTKIPVTATIVGKTDDSGTTVSSENFPDKDTTHDADPKNPEATTAGEWFDSSTTQKPSEGFSLINFVKKVAEIKFRLGLTILKHASEGFARYLGHVQKRINGEE